MSDWIKHDGKGMPVPSGTIVLFKMREEDGDDFQSDIVDASILDWVHRDDGHDIVAYRVIQAPSSQAMDELIEASSEELDIPSSQANREGEEQ